MRGKKVILGRDLATLYGVPTKALNQAVKRNLERFPDNFMFQLNKEEKDELVTNCDQFNTLKHSTVMPFAFTEYGVAMLSSVLNSKRAIQINITIINAFVKMREMFENFKKNGEMIEKMKRDYDQITIQGFYKLIRQMLNSRVLVKEEAHLSLDSFWINNLLNLAQTVKQNYGSSPKHVGKLVI